MTPPAAENLTPASRPTTPRVLAAGVITAFVATLLALLAGVLDASAPLTFGHDFLPPYVVGSLVRDGQAAHLHEAAATVPVARSVVADQNLTNDPSIARWINPTFFAAAFAPFSVLPYRAALLAWTALNAGLLGGSLAVLWGWVPATRRAGVGFGLAVLASCPLLLAVEHQQNTFVSLALVVAATAAWRGGRPTLAGLAIGCLAYKPQIAALLGIAVWAHQGRRALAGLLLGGGGWLLLGEVLARGSTLAFLRDVPPIVREIQSLGFNWGRQVTPTTFLRVLPGVPLAVATWVGAAISLAVVTAVARFAVRRRGSDGADRVIAAAVAALPLAAPYFMDYDLLLLAVPAALTLRSAPRRTTVALWAALWVVAFVNIDLVQVLGLNAVVPVLVLVALSSAGLGRWPAASRGLSFAEAGGSPTATDAKPLETRRTSIGASAGEAQTQPVAVARRDSPRRLPGVEGVRVLRREVDAAAGERAA
ncbi:MAG TPA: glycosyltransferase family 87 protein [Humisphaera sp.]